MMLSLRTKSRVACSGTFQNQHYLSVCSRYGDAANLGGRRVEDNLALAFGGDRALIHLPLLAGRNIVGGTRQD
jgi:hypothetical protein